MKTGILAGRFVGEQRVEHHEMLENRSTRPTPARRPSSHSATPSLASACRWRPGWRRRHGDQRVDRLFGKRQRVPRVDDAAMHGVAHQHCGASSAKNAAAASMASRGRPAVVRASCQAAKPRQRRHAVARQQPVEHRRCRQGRRRQWTGRWRNGNSTNAAPARSASQARHRSDSGSQRPARPTLRRARLSSSQD